MRLFNSGAAAALMNRSSVPDDSAIESKVVSRAILSAQSQVEARNAEIRKNILKYDDVMNRQREAIYTDRRAILQGEDISGTFQVFLEQVITETVNSAVSDSNAADWDLDSLWTTLKAIYPVGLEIEEVLEEAGSRSKISAAWLAEEVLSDARLAYRKRTEEVGEELMRELERRVMLSVIDRKWRDHLYEMDYLKDGIGLRAMAQRDPLIEYQREGYTMFQAMMGMIREESVGFIFNLDVQVVPAGGVTQVQSPAIAPAPVPTAELSYSAPNEDGDIMIRGQSGGQPAPTERLRPRRGPAQPPAKGGGAKGAFGQPLDN
jgi:preprotein translocase subunit SecA